MPSCAFDIRVAILVFMRDACMMQPQHSGALFSLIKVNCDLQQHVKWSCNQCNAML